MPLRATSIHGVSIPCLVPLTAGGTRPPIILADSSIVIGSGDAAQIRLKSLSVSKAHALVLVDDAKVYVRDLASRTELFVNDVAVREAWLRHGDVVRVGRFGFGVVEDAALQGRPAGSAAPAMVLRVEGEPADRQITEPVVLIGRRSKCDLSVLDEALSGSHAILFRIGARWYLRDLSSRTGTFVNGTPVRQQRALAEGDLIRAGRTEMRFLGEERQARVPRMAEELARGPMAAVSDVPAVAVVPAALIEPIAASKQPLEATKPVVPMVIAREEIANPPAAAQRVHEEARVEAPVGVAGPLPAAAAVVPPAAPAIEADRTLERAAEVTDMAEGKAAEEVAAPIPAMTTTVAVAPAAPAMRVEDQPPMKAKPAVAAASAAPRHASAAAEVSTRWVGVQAREVGSGRMAEEPPAAPPQGWGAAASATEDDSAVGVEFHPSADVRPAAAARVGAGGESNPSDTEWEEAVTVWSFEDLARRSSADRAGEETESAGGQRLVWVAVAVGVACLGMMGVLAYKMF